MRKYVFLKELYGDINFDEELLDNLVDKLENLYEQLADKSLTQKEQEKIIKDEIIDIEEAIANCEDFEENDNNLESNLKDAISIDIEAILDYQNIDFDLEDFLYHKDW